MEMCFVENCIFRFQTSKILACGLLHSNFLDQTPNWIFITANTLPSMKDWRKKINFRFRLKFLILYLTTLFLTVAECISLKIYFKATRECIHLKIYFILWQIYSTKVQMNSVKYWIWILSLLFCHLFCTFLVSPSR